MKFYFGSINFLYTVIFFIWFLQSFIRFVHVFRGIEFSKQFFIQVYWDVTHIPYSLPV